MRTRRGQCSPAARSGATKTRRRVTRERTGAADLLEDFRMCGPAITHESLQRFDSRWGQFQEKTEAIGLTRHKC